MSTGALRRVYHLNCGSFRPWNSLSLVTHVLLCEMEHGLVLVDVGMGIDDLASPGFRLGHSPRMAGAQFISVEAAVYQVERLGFNASDVTDVVATHLDYDHIGGLSDFPEATLHTMAVELAEARNPAHTRGGQIRYRPAHTACIRNFEAYEEAGATILGMNAVELRNISGLYLVPMPGHTLGHAAVAIKDPTLGWIVHAGDSFMHRSSIEVDASIPLSARVIRGIEQLMATDRKLVHNNHIKLRELAQSGVRVFCSHDSVQFEGLRNEGVALVKPMC